MVCYGKWNDDIITVLSLISCDRYDDEPNVGSAPLKSYESTALIAQKTLKSTDKEMSAKDKSQYDDDSFSSNNTLYSENTSFSGILSFISFYAKTLFIFIDVSNAFDL